MNTKEEALDFILKTQIAWVEDSLRDFPDASETRGFLRDLISARETLRVPNKRFNPDEVSGVIGAFSDVGLAAIEMDSAPEWVGNTSTASPKQVYLASQAAVDRGINISRIKEWL